MKIEKIQACSDPQPYIAQVLLVSILLGWKILNDLPVSVPNGSNCAIRRESGIQTVYDEFFNEILFVCRYSFPKEKKVATFPSRPFPLCEHFREIQHFNSQFDKCEKYKVFFVVFGILNVLFVSSKAN